METTQFVKALLQQALHLETELSDDLATPLLGSLSELDSIGVVNVISLIEEQLDCIIADDEISADVFETLGSLITFVASKQ